MFTYMLVLIDQSLQHSMFIHVFILKKKFAISKYQFRQKTFADGMEASRIRCQLSTGLMCGLMKIRSSIYFYHYKYVMINCLKHLAKTTPTHFMLLRVELHVFELANFMMTMVK